MQLAQIYNSDYWNQTNFDEGVRQYEKSFAEDVRQFDTSFAEGQRQFNESLAEQKRQHNDQMSYNWASLSKKSGSGGLGDGGYKFSSTEISALTKAYNEACGGDAGIEAALSIANALGKAPQNEEQANILYGILGDTVSATTKEDKQNKSGIDWTSVEITKKTDTANGILGIKNLWGGIDSNDVYTIGNKTYYADDIEEAMKTDKVPEATRKQIIHSINKLKEGNSYKYK
jgi:hypothetical protein